MRTISLLIRASLCLLFFAGIAEAQDIQKKINLKVEKASVADVLDQLRARYGFRFSYLNNDLSADTVYNFQVQEKPLSEVLDQLLENSEAGYQYHNNQIIIKKGFQKQQPAKDEKKKKALIPEGPDNKESEKNDQEAAQNSSHQRSQGIKEQQAGEKAKTETDSLAEAGQAKNENNVSAEGKDLSVLNYTLKTPAEESVIKKEEKNENPESTFTGSGPGQERSRDTAPEEDNTEKTEPFWKRLSFKGKGKREATAEMEEESLSDTAVSPLHIGFFYPLSNHGTKAPEKVNNLSVHVLVGVAAGLEGWEFSGLGNIEKDFVHGYQFAGLLNVAGNEVRGLQFAGLLNKNGEKLEGGQFAGLLNYAGGEGKGLQASGLMNIAGGSFYGVQAAGLLNKAGSTEGVQASGLINIADSLKGPQLAGFINKAGYVKGVQASGFLNQAKEVEGSQFAGFYNNAGDVKGIQTSGFINKAKHVRGVQIGILNFADSVSGGVPIGFFSFVKNGYRAFEVYTGEDFHANVNFKIGVKKFYNILAVGLELNGNKRSAFGYGIGSEWGLGNKMYITTDAIAYGVNEKSFTENLRIGSSEEYPLNLLNKLRLLATWQPGRRFALFGGPTYNVMVSRYQESPESALGSGLVENTFFDRTNRKTNVKMWIGFNAGIRF